MNTRATGKTALVLAVAIVTLGVAFGAAAKLPHRDAAFLQKASADGIAEVEMAKMAREKAMREEVRQFADRIIPDHIKANEEITALAMSNGVEPAEGPTKKQLKEMEKMRKLVGGDFDRAFMKHMVKDHEEDLKDFRRVAKAKEPNDVTLFARKTVPILQDHLASARATYDIAMQPKRTGNRKTGSTKP